MMIYMEVLIYWFLGQFNLTHILNNLWFMLFLISLLSIAAAGYVYNDVVDQRSDQVNKPGKTVVANLIKVEQAKRLYLFLNTIGIVCGVVLCLYIDHPSYAFFFIGTAYALYVYSNKLQGIPLVGNVLVALLISLLVILPLILEDAGRFPEIAVSAIILLALFAFLLNLIRELVKDILDVDGDRASGLRTLPILIGRSRVSKLASGLCLLSAMILIYGISFLGPAYPVTALLLFLGAVLPLGFVAVKLWRGTPHFRFNMLSNLLKLSMFVGMHALLTLILFD
jgi:4-hydroxybenzoate polyprenyltransferase